jgi:hypothetical protein
MKKILIIILLILCSTIVIAVQPTQQYNKLLLSPFYLASMTQNTNYSYSVSIITPDGISQVKSAILTLDAWINPTRTFNAWMNGVVCNTPSYTVSTTYAGAGRAVLTFDCTNAIIPNSVNTVTFRVAGGNIGASTAWLDLTYMNNPVGGLILGGTEYQINDNGTVFLQLLDNNQQPVNNSICYLTMFSPDKTKILDGAMMTYLLTSEGLYYYDFIVPNTVGVYMISARCFYYYNITYITDIKDSWTSSTAPTTNYGNNTFFTVGKASSAILNSYIEFNLSNISSINDINEVWLYLYVSSQMSSPIVNIYHVTSSWNELNITWNNSPTTNSYIYDSKKTLSGWNVWNITSLTKSWINGTIQNYGIFLNASLSTGTWNFSSFSSRENSVELSPRLLIKYKTLEQINDVRGDGEVHVSNLPLSVWNNPYRNLTYYQNFSIPQTDLTNYSMINDSISYNINLSTEVILYKISELETYIVTNIYSIINNTWNYVTTIPLNVWNYATRNLTYYQNFTEQQQDLTNYTIINEGVWNNPYRNLTYYKNCTADLINYTLITENVWDYAGRYIHGVLI